MRYFRGPRPIRENHDNFTRQKLPIIQKEEGGDHGMGDCTCTVYVWEITHVLGIYEYQPSGVTASPGGCPDLKLKMICHKIHTG